jgi:hypothetical protein
MDSFPVFPCKQENPLSVAIASVEVAKRFFAALVGHDYKNLCDTKEFLQKILDEEFIALVLKPHEFLQLFGKCISELATSPDKKRARLLVMQQAMRLVMTYSIQAFIAQEDENPDLNRAWGAAVDATRWAGWLEGQWAARCSSAPIRVEMPEFEVLFKKRLSEIGKHGGITKAKNTKSSIVKEYAIREFEKLKEANPRISNKQAAAKLVKKIKTFRDNVKAKYPLDSAIQERLQKWFGE